METFRRKHAARGGKEEGNKGWFRQGREEGEQGGEVGEASSFTIRSSDP